MQEDEIHIRHIRATLPTLQTKEDLLELLNYAKSVLYEQKARPFTLTQLTWYANPGINKKRYTSFTIPKKNSETGRTINAPVPGLKSFQKVLAYILECVFEPHKAATGFVPDKSVVDNAKVHAAHWYVYNIDLQDFFPSIDQARVWKCLQLKPFHIESLPVRNIIAALCCTEMEVTRLDGKDVWQTVKRNVLPQGAPTSPILSNIVCQKLDFLLTAVAKRFGARYSRYADDITFSSLHNIYQLDSDFLKELNRIITDQRFYIKPSKTRLQKQGYRQEVTGLIVNDKVNVSKRYVKEIRKWLYYWERYGEERSQEFFSDYYTKDKHVDFEPSMSQVLRGKLDFLSMVRGKDDPLFQKLFTRLRLLRPNKIQRIPSLSEKDSYEMVNYISPKETTKFLKYFKYDNEFTFKQLVHRPIDETNFNFIELLRKSYWEFVALGYTADGKLNLPETLFKAMKSLFSTLATYGLDYVDKTGKHPMDEPVTGKEIQQFKRDYRFGNEKTESSILSDIIISTAKNRISVDHSAGMTYSFNEEDNSGIFNINQIIFQSGEQKFQSKANFFTWVPNVVAAFAITFESILKHGNVAESRSFAAADKKIVVDIVREAVDDEIKIELTILDKGSLFKGNIDTLMLDMRRDYYKVLNGVCDFKIECINKEGQAFECRVFPFANALEKINRDPGGFKYIFTFYD